MMEFGWLEILLLCLSGFTFLAAIFLLFVVVLKGGSRVCCCDDEYGADQFGGKSDAMTSYYRTSSPSDILHYNIQKPVIEVQVTSPDGSIVSEKTREHILSSHPHFWNNVTSSKQSYGSIGYKSASPTEMVDKKFHMSCEDLSSAPYKYGIVKFHFLKSTDKETPSMFRLISIKTQKLTFKIRDLFLELRCKKPADKSTEEDAVEKDIADEEHDSTSSSATEESCSKTRYTVHRVRHDSSDDQNKCDVKISLSKISQPLVMTEKLLFEADSETFQPVVKASCFLSRSDTKVYIATAIEADPDIKQEKQSAEKGSDEKSEDEVDDQCAEVVMEFVHDPKVKIGRALLAITYLPTAEKISIGIKEFVLAEEKEARTVNILGPYWKLTYHRWGKRRSKRKLEINHTDQKHHIWSSDNVITLDRVTPDSVTTSYFVCSLMSKRQGHEEVTSQVLKSTKVESLKQSDIDSRTKKTRGERDIIVGEIYVGCDVPDSTCREHWLEVLRIPRLTVEKWHILV